MRRVYQVVAVIVLNTLLLLIGIELVAGIVLANQAEAPLAEQVESFIQKQVGLSYYREQAWSRAYWDEHMQVVDHWEYAPYIIWRTRPFEGEYIKVDEVRHTPGSDCSDDKFRIFMFGGSTMWGFGAPDWGTIPAYVQAEMGEAVCVVNYGEVAFNSTQSVIRLLLELQKGNIPDLVIFYDGVNEVTIANLTGESDAHFYLDDIESAIQGNLAFGSPEEAEASPLLDFLRQSATYRLLVRQEAPEPSFAVPPFEQVFLDEIVNAYLTNVDVAAALAEAYGFEFLALWQPVLVMQESAVNDEEQRFLWEMPGGLPELFQAIYPRIAAAADTRAYLVDFSRVLDGQAGSLWIDFNHLSPAGNALVAAAVVELIE